MLSAALMVASLLAAGPDAPPKCATDHVPFRGRCFDRYEFWPGDPSCPEGVIVIPDGENTPRCVSCEDYDGMQQPMNYCTGMIAEKAEAKLKATLEEVVKRLPAREQELRKGQRDWAKKRDAACRRAGKQYEGGSMQEEVENDCLLDRTKKRIAELARIGGLPAPAVSARPTAAGAQCAGDPGDQTRVDRRASIVVDKSRFLDEPKPCPADGSCPWRRKAYVVRGDEVTESAVSHDFACVTFKTTSGWLPLRDLCEAGAACASK
jgi:uncharacterized protein YecT (DUF1311 family)